MAMPQRGDPPMPRLPTPLKLPPPRFALGRSRRRTSRRTSMILLRACELQPSPSLPSSHLHAHPRTHIAICVRARTKCPASHGAFTRPSPEVHTFRHILQYVYEECSTSQIDTLNGGRESKLKYLRTHLHGNLEGINPKGADGRNGPANVKAKIKLRM